MLPPARSLRNTAPSAVTPLQIWQFSTAGPKRCYVLYVDACKDDFERLAEALNRLTAAIEQQAAGLGVATEPRYTSRPNDRKTASPVNEAQMEPLSDLATESTMAQMLGIAARTLGKYRRAGKFAGCWVQNGRRVRWNVSRTLETWKRGIA